MATPWMIVGRSLAIVTCLYAFGRGDKYHKQAGFILGLGWIISSAIGRTMSDPTRYIFVIDIIALIGFGWVSLKSRQLWSLCMTAFQLNAVISHTARFVAFDLSRFSYITAIEFWGGYAITLALLSGLIARDVASVWHWWRTRLNKDSFSTSLN